MPAAKEIAYNTIAELIEKFEEHHESYNKSDYNKKLTLKDFIDPFFKALGWDINNEPGYAKSFREVIRRGNPCGCPTSKNEIQPAYRIRRYGRNAGMLISIITDFAGFAVYDCTKRPFPTDKPAIARIKYSTCKDYLKEFDFLFANFLIVAIAHQPL